VDLYYERSDYFCVIVPNPPMDSAYLSQHKTGWYVLNYRMFQNKKFKYDETSLLETFYAYFKNKENRIFRISFKCST
jgi:hypothetical protein